MFKLHATVVCLTVIFLRLKSGFSQDSFNATLAAHFCDGVLCQNGGVCSVVGYASSHYVCVCPQGYAGLHCGVQITESCVGVTETFRRGRHLQVYDDLQYHVDVTSEDECKTACLTNDTCKTADYQAAWGSCLLHPRFDHDEEALVYSSNGTVHLVRDCITALVSSEKNVTDNTTLETCSPVSNTIESKITLTVPGPPSPSNHRQQQYIYVTTGENAQCATNLQLIYPLEGTTCNGVKACKFVESSRVETVYEECVYECKCTTDNCEVNIFCPHCKSPIEICNAKRVVPLGP